MNRKFRAFAGFFPYIAISLIPVITLIAVHNTTKLSRTIDYIFIYLEDSDIIISSQGVTDSRLYYEAYFDSLA